MDRFSIEGKIAIVTGGNQGIGHAIAKGYAEAGAAVIIVNRREAEGRKAAEDLANKGLKAKAISGDVSVRSAVDRVVAKVMDEFGKIDVGRTPHAALGTRQTAPYGFVGWFFQLIQRALDNLPGRKIRKNSGHGAATCAYTAVQAVIGPCDVYQFGYFSHSKSSIFLNIVRPLVLIWTVQRP